MTAFNLSMSLVTVEDYRLHFSTEVIIQGQNFPTFSFWSFLAPEMISDASFSPCRSHLVRKGCQVAAQATLAAVVLHLILWPPLRPPRQATATWKRHPRQQDAALLSIWMSHQLPGQWLQTPPLSFVTWLTTTSWIATLVFNSPHLMQPLTAG